MLKSKRPHYRVTLADAIGAHERAVGQFGGHGGLLDQGRIEAAVARPYSGYYRPIHKKATALIQSVACNHGFVDGNKRTAYYLFYLLLERSSYGVQENTSTHQQHDIEHLVLDLTTGFLEFGEAAAWLKRRIFPL